MKARFYSNKGGVVEYELPSGAILLRRSPPSECADIDIIIRIGADGMEVIHGFNWVTWKEGRKRPEWRSVFLQGQSLARCLCDAFHHCWRKCGEEYEHLAPQVPQWMIDKHLERLRGIEAEVSQ